MAALNFPNSPAYGDIYDKYKWDGEKWCLTLGGRPATAPNSAEAIAFLARTSGLNAVHTDAYKVLIDGLVLDGVWPKFDILYIFGTQDSATALLNLKSSSYNATALGSPAFVADRGFTGVSGSTTVYINTNFNPSTAVGAQYTQNSAHISDWTYTNDTSLRGAVGASTAGSGNVPWETLITGTTMYARVNVDGAAVGGGQNFTSASGTGHFVVVRTDSTHVGAYCNASSLGTALAGQTSMALLNLNFYAIGMNTNGNVAVGAPQQQFVVSAGSQLSGTDITNFYNRLRGYLTMIGGNTIAGPGSMIVPAGKTTLVGEAWGAGGTGGGGGTSVGTGGGGGGYSRFTTSVTAGQVIYYNVGAGVIGVGGAGSAGGNSWVNPAANSQPTSNGCVGGGGGGSDGGSNRGVGGVGTIGTVNFTGGIGGFGSNPVGGGGGGCAGSAGNGGDASVHTGGIGGTPDGAPGMDGGGNGNLPSLAPGGGGGGAWGFNAGDSANGQVRLTFT